MGAGVFDAVSEYACEGGFVSSSDWRLDEFEDGILQMLKDILEYTRYTKVLANQNSNMYCLF